MQISKLGTVRELSEIELNKVTGGNCQCGSSSPCVHKVAVKGGGYQLVTCGGLALYGGWVFH
jgi:hypothetical protein